MAEQEPTTLNRATEKDMTQSDGMDFSDGVWKIPAGSEIENNPSFEELAAAIERIVHVARKHIANEANKISLASYWATGRMIVVYEQNGSDRATYGEKTIKELSKRLTLKLGRGYSVTNLQLMRRFYLAYQNQQTVSAKLTWSHYIDLISVDDDIKRSFYTHEAINAGWSVRELRHQIDSMLFERVLKARDEATKTHVIKLANEGIVPRDPVDILREPYLLDFVDLPIEKPPLESDLEAALIKQIESFMLELGRGFMFVGSQQRVTIGNVHYYVDMVFYNKLLRSYVLIELKTTPLTPAAVGQVNAYLNYYAEEMNDKFDNPPIGIILCTDRRNIDARYALGGLTNRVFAQTYTTVLPDKEQLEEQVRRIIEANEHKSLEEGSSANKLPDIVS